MYRSHKVHRNSHVPLLERCDKLPGNFHECIVVTRYMEISVDLGSSSHTVHGNYCVPLLERSHKLHGNFHECIEVTRYMEISFFFS